MSDVRDGEEREARRREGKRPTMTDVAKIAGVSQSSVSLVLNQMPGSRISADTQARVIEAARAIGYALPRIRNDQLRAETGTATGTAGGIAGRIAFVVDEISTSPHPVISFDGIRDFAFEQGLLATAFVTRSNPALEAQVLTSIVEDSRYAGIVYATIFTRRVALPPILAGYPAVLLNCYGEPRRHMAVVPGEVAGGFTATAHLTALGHRRIGFINGEPWMDAAVDRLKGYKQALATADIAFDPRLVRAGDWLPQRGFEACRELLEEADPPTAIFCGNDLMAMGAIQAAREAGLRVPDDLSVMGYDDQELARYTNPPLSTVLLPNYEMGQRAAELLVDIAVHRKAPRPMTLKIDGPLVPRASTAAPGARRGIRVADLSGR